MKCFDCNEKEVNTPLTVCDECKHWQQFEVTDDELNAIVNRVTNRTAREQFIYETRFRGLDRVTAFNEMRWMFSSEQLDKLKYNPDRPATTLRLTDDLQCIAMTLYCEAGISGTEFYEPERRDDGAYTLTSLDGNIKITVEHR